MKQLGFMAIDQHGCTYHLDTMHPRKELLEKFGRKHASKMYIDLKQGGSRHKGYIIAGLWLSLYRVCLFRD